MKQITIGLLLIISLSGYAQTSEKNFIDQNYIEVTGKAEMEVVPDLIYLRIILSDKDNKGKQSIAETEKEMITKLTEIGVDVNKDLAVKDFVSSFQLYWLSKADVILTKQFQLLIHDAKKLQKIFVEFQKIGISNVSIEKLDNTKIDQYKKDVKVKAVKAAKDKADLLTSAINQTVGKALFIQEVDGYNPYLSRGIPGANSNVVIRGTATISEDSDIEFEKIKLESTILVKFELK